MATKKAKTTKKAVAKTAVSKKPATARKDQRVVFAFRLTPDERDTIHKAAGPRGASQFVLQTALAAAGKVKS